MKKTHWMVRLVQIAAVLFVLLACLMVFIYTPFYSQLIVKGLNYFVPVEVNEVAAKSQKLAALSDQDSYEPGSDMWIARQSYLTVMEEAIQSDNSQNLTLIQARYKALQALIEDDQQKESDEKEKPAVPLLASSASEASIENPPDAAQKVKELLELNSSANQELMAQYVDFLKTHKVEQPASEPGDEQIFKDIALIHDQNQQKTEVKSAPYAIVVLGGGLTLDKNGKDIVVNNYTRLRLETTLAVEKDYQLPIVLSGVEAPYMQSWLKQHNVDAKLLEDTYEGFASNGANLSADKKEIFKQLRKYKIEKNNISNINFLKKSIDSRNKKDIKFIYNLEITLKSKMEISNNKNLTKINEEFLEERKSKNKL